MPPPKLRVHSRKADEAIHMAVLSAQKARHLLYEVARGQNEQTEKARQQWQIALEQLKIVQKKYHLYMNTQQRIDLYAVQEMLECHGTQVLSV